MPLAGQRHVDVPVELDAHGPPGLAARPARPAPRARCPASPCRRSRRPCAATATTTWLRGLPSTSATIAWISEGCCVEEQTKTSPVLPRLGPRRLRLEVEMLLAAGMRTRPSSRCGRRRAAPPAQSPRADRRAARCESCPARPPRRSRGSAAAARSRPRPAPPRRGTPRATRRPPAPPAARGSTPRRRRTAVSSWRATPTLLAPGMSSAIRTAATPGIARACAASRRRIRARACGEQHRPGLEHRPALRAMSST